jgi:pimeloyl-ACP methyl ester carboxylesterase
MGNSMGGWLALQYAAAHPQKTNALILLAPSGIVAPANDFIDRTAALSSSDDSGIQETSNGELPNSTCQNAAESSELLDAVMDSASLPPEVLAFMTLIMTHFIPMTGALPILSDAQMKNLSMPVLCLLADGDVTMNPAAAAKRLTSLVPHAIVTPIEGAHVITSAAAFALPFLKESR